MTCESVVSAIAAGQAASLFWQKVDGFGRPVRTHNGEAGGEAFRIEHDAVGLQSSPQRGLFLDVDLPGDAIVHTYGLSSRHPGWGCVAWGRAEWVWLRARGAGGGRSETHSGGCHRGHTGCLPAAAPERARRQVIRSAIEAERRLRAGPSR